MDTRQFERIKETIAKAPANQVLDLETFIHAHVSRQLADFRYYGANAKRAIV
jgi:hypothetical protein